MRVPLSHSLAPSLIELRLEHRTQVRDSQPNLLAGCSLTLARP
jgi:hypothetical protein